MIVHYALRVIGASTPCLIGVAVCLFFSWLIIRCYDVALFSNEAKWFLGQKRLHKLTIVCAIALLCHWAGSKDRGVSSSDAVGDAFLDNVRAAKAAKVRALSEGIATNALTISGFGIDTSGRSARFAVRWAANIFDCADSRNLLLFSSTNLLDRKWTPLCAIPVPANTNAHSFAVAETDIHPSMRQWFADAFGGIGFYRFGIDLDTDRDGLADGEEVYFRTNLLLADTDRDGLDDGRECTRGTNPLQPDTDADGMNDGWEFRSGFDPCADNAADGDPDNDICADPDGLFGTDNTGDSFSGEGKVAYVYALAPLRGRQIGIDGFRLMTGRSWGGRIILPRRLQGFPISAIIIRQATRC